MIGRRELMTGLISLVAAPAIVRAGSLMPVRTMLLERSYYVRLLRWNGWVHYTDGLVFGETIIKSTDQWFAGDLLIPDVPISEIPQRVDKFRRIKIGEPWDMIVLGEVKGDPKDHYQSLHSRIAS